MLLFQFFNVIQVEMGENSMLHLFSNSYFFSHAIVLKSRDSA